MKKKITALFVCIGLLISVLGGCWNYADVDDQFVVMGVAIDYDEDTQEYILYAEIAKAKGGTETEQLTRLEAFRGATLFDATRNGIMKIGAKIYWGHTMVYAISEKVAKMGITDVMSLLSRQTQIRSDIFILVCSDDSIGDFFKFDDPIHQSVSQHIYDLLLSYESSGKFRSTPLYMILQELASEDMSVMLPYIKMIEDETSSGADEQEQAQEESDESDEKSDKLLIVEGSAVFKADKMKGRFDEIETRSALILKEEVRKNYVLTHEEQGDIPAFTVEVMNSKIKLDTQLDEDDKLKITVDLELEGDLVELQTLEDFITDEKKGELEDAINNMVNGELSDVLKKAQRIGSDVFGIAGIMHRKEPKKFKEIEGKWDEVLVNAELEINVELIITSSSLSINPVKVGS